MNSMLAAPNSTKALLIASTTNTIFAAVESMTISTSKGSVSIWQSIFGRVRRKHIVNNELA